MGEKRVRTCPRCNSPDINNDYTNIGVVMGLAEQYRCNNCGYTAAQFPTTPVSAFDDEEYEVKEIADEEEHRAGDEEKERRLQYIYGVVAALTVYMLFFTPNPVLFAALSLLAAILLVWEWWKRYV